MKEHEKEPLKAPGDWREEFLSLFFERLYKEKGIKIRGKQKTYFEELYVAGMREPLLFKWALVWPSCKNPWSWVLEGRAALERLRGIGRWIRQYRVSHRGDRPADDQVDWFRANATPEHAAWAFGQDQDQKGAQE